jgi:hypothetical protein
MTTTPSETSLSQIREEIRKKVEAKLTALQPTPLDKLHKVNAKWLHLTNEDKEFLEVAS